jgi:uncharacterized membrane protein YhhN
MNAWVVSGVLLAAGAAIQAVGAGAQPRRFYFLKPLTTSLILLGAWLEAPTPMRAWIVGGLGLSLIGDICLMFPGDRAFMGGLGSFLLAHLAFIAAFSLGVPLAAPPLWTALLGLYALGLLIRLWPRTGRLRIPVLAYSLVLFAMALAAARAHQVHQTTEAAWGLAGALAFVASDSLLAGNRFLRPHRHAQVAILLTYWGALLCLVGALPG